MENNKQFTNEELAKKFKNNFELVNYAISLAENMISTGRDARVRRADMQNRAMLILEEIREGKDQFDELPQEGEKATHGGMDAPGHTYETRREPTRNKIEAIEFEDED